MNDLGLNYMVNEHILTILFWVIDIILLIGVIVGFLLCSFYCSRLVYLKMRKEDKKDKIKKYKKRAKLSFIVMIVSFILLWFVLMLALSILGE